MKWFPALIFLLISYLALIVYANRALYFSKFDESYWRDKYEHSQWSLPLSVRTIGDDGLYLYESYRLINGADPTRFNAEVPPLGKYLIGGSILVFQNGYIYGFLVTCSLLLASYVLFVKLSGSTILSLATVVLLATDPLITNQYKLTMLDALQTLFLLLYVIALMSNRWLISGVLLGLFSETKAPILAPMLLTIGSGYILFQTKKLRAILVFGFGTLIGYIVPYIPYFLQGHTISEWLAVQKWIVAFYKNSNLDSTVGSAITTLLTGTYQNIFSGQWEKAAEWSPVWALLLLSISAITIQWISNHSRSAKWGVILIVFWGILGIFSFIPFWTRYTVLLLPLLYISISALFARLNTTLSIIVFGVLLITNVASSYPILFPPVTNTINQYLYTASHMFYADLYQDLTNDSKKTISPTEFRMFAETAMADGQIEHIEIVPIGVTTVDNKNEVFHVRATYFTRQLGSFSRTISIPFVRQDNRWRIPWKWSMLIPGLQYGAQVETRVDVARRGSILASDKKPLAEDAPGYLVWILPDKIDKSREDELLSLLETLFNGTIPKVALHQRIVGLTLGNRAIPIGVIPHPKTDPKIQTLSRFDGVTLTEAYTRLSYPNNVAPIGEVKNTAFSECCSYLYSTTNYDGVSGVEKTKNDSLKGIHGGSLVIKDSNDAILETLISQTKKDGVHVQP